MGNSSSGSGPDLGDVPGEPAAAERPRQGRRSRILVPATVAAVAAAGLIAVPVFAASSDLPSVTAQQLLAKVLSSKVQTFSGTVQTSVDLGLPSQLVSAIPSAVAGAAGGSAGAGAAGSASSAQAERQLGSLLSGSHVLKVAADGPTRQLIGSADPGSAFTVVHNGSSAWAYDAGSRSATHFTGVGAGAAASSERTSLDPQQAAADALKALGSSTTVSVAGQSKVAGQSVYELSVRPKGTGSTVGEVRIAVDAANGMPLEVRVLPADGSDPILDVAFSTVSFATPSAGTFDFTPPSGVKVTEQAAPAQPSTGRPTAPEGRHGAADSPGVTVSGSGWGTVYIVKPPAQQGRSGVSGELSAVKEFGKPVAGGTLVSTKLVNVLVTGNGTVYAGAVTPSVLEAAAGR